MPEKNYIIVGPDSLDRDARLFWKQEENQPVPIGEWTLEVEEATEYDRSILGPTPLPEGLTSIINVKTMDEYTIDTLPTIGGPIL